MNRQSLSGGQGCGGRSHRGRCSTPGALGLDLPSRLAADCLGLVFWFGQHLGGGLGASINASVWQRTCFTSFEALLFREANLVNWIS